MTTQLTNYQNILYTSIAIVCARKTGRRVGRNYFIQEPKPKAECAQCEFCLMYKTTPLRFSSLQSRDPTPKVVYYNMLII